MRLGPSIGDQFVVDLPREREVSHAGVVDMPNLSTAEPVDGCWWNPKPALARTTSSCLLADSGPAKHLALDHLEQFIIHGVLLSRVSPAAIGWHEAELCRSYESTVFGLYLSTVYSLQPPAYS
jgi:hypothetical protein